MSNAMSNAPPRRSWSSSMLYDWERTGCAATLVHIRQGTPRDVQMFAAGEVAHLLLDAAARITQKDPSIFGDELEAELTRLSRRYLHSMPRWGATEKPPVGPAAAAEGLRLALGWIAAHGVPEGQSEIGLAIADDLRTPVPYESPDARWRGLLDLLTRREDFDEETGEDFEILEIADGKSAWPDRLALTLQRKGQAILALAHRDHPPDRLVLKTNNLRRRSEGDPYVTDDPVGDVDRWREELAAILEAADKAAAHHSIESAARVGPGCGICPYLRHCGPGLGFVANPAVAQNGESVSATEVLVAAWGSATAIAKLFRGYLADIVDRAGTPVDAGNGRFVERGERVVRKLREGFAGELWDKWYHGGDAESVARGLLARLNLGIENAESLIRTLPTEERKPFRKWLASRVQEERGPFGIKVTKGGIPIVENEEVEQ